MANVVTQNQITREIKGDIFAALRTALTAPASSKSKKSWTEAFIEQMLSEARKEPSGPLGQLVAKQIMQEDILSKLDAETDKALAKDVDFLEYRLMKLLYDKQREVFLDDMIHKKILIGSRRIGKTTLAKKYMKDVIDLESGNFKWIENGNTESTKGDNKRTQNPRYPINYLEAIKEANSKYKVVLISQHEVIRKCLDAVKLDYIIAYPDIQLKDEYIERYRHRGNNENFINLISREWNNWISALNDIEGHNKIVLKSGQFLEDYVVELGLEDRPVDNVHNSVDNYESDTENLSEKTENNTTKELTKQTQVQTKDITISNTLDSLNYNIYYLAKKNIF